MAAKPRAVYVCQQCGAQYANWLGRCLQCQSWNSLVAQTIASPSKKLTKSASQPIPIESVKANTSPRFPTGLTELDRVLGGGLVPGAVVLLAGNPGIGKSTLLLQVAASEKTLYITGEESPDQIAMRYRRVGKSAGNLSLLPETDVETIVAVMRREQPKLTIIDSIQTLTTTELPGSAGSIGQVRECAQRLTRVAKELHSAVFFVGHVTREGSVAGPMTLEHVVDVTLFMEGDPYGSQRLIRCMKNRFGPTQELGIFVMDSNGFRDEPNPSRLFLDEHTRGLPGSCLVVLIEGNRPLLVELQALVVSTSLPVPRRVATGLDVNRLHVLLAVLTRHAGISFAQYDVYINVVGGLIIRDPAADLGVCLALTGSLRGNAFPEGLVALGEVGLLGEVRPVQYEAMRVKEAKRLHYTRLLTATSAPTIQKALAGVQRKRSDGQSKK